MPFVCLVPCALRVADTWSTKLGCSRAYLPFHTVTTVRPTVLVISVTSKSYDRLLVRKGRSRSKSKPTRGLDLGEVRRRTSLLSGRSAAPSPPVPAPSRPTAAPSRPATSSPYFDADWGRQGVRALSYDEVPPHPLHAHAAASRGGSGGNYFNEEVLRTREQERCAGAHGVGQGGRGGNDLMDSAGNFLNTARSGDKASF